jgi:hypothetical protein
MKRAIAGQHLPKPFGREDDLRAMHNPCDGKASFLWYTVYVVEPIRHMKYTALPTCRAAMAFLGAAVLVWDPSPPRHIVTSCGKASFGQELI